MFTTRVHSGINAARSDVTKGGLNLNMVITIKILRNKILMATKRNDPQFIGSMTTRI